MMTRDMLDIVVCIGTTCLLGILSYAHEFIFGGD